MSTYEAEATLAELETEFHRLADNWRAEFLKTRALRIQFRGLPTAIAEMGRDAGAEPEVATRRSVPARAGRRDTIHI